MQTVTSSIFQCPHIAVDVEAVQKFCVEERIDFFALFGSVLRDDFKANSDVDVLYEFSPGYGLGLAIFDLEERMSKLFQGHPIDLVSRKYLNHRLKDRVLNDCVVLYER